MISSISGYNSRVEQRAGEARSRDMAVRMGMDMDDGDVFL